MYFSGSELDTLIALSSCSSFGSVDLETKRYLGDHFIAKSKILDKIVTLSPFSNVILRAEPEGSRGYHLRFQNNNKVSNKKWGNA
jgi:hypothetical protein